MAGVPPARFRVHIGVGGLPVFDVGVPGVGDGAVLCPVAPGAPTGDDHRLAFGEVAGVRGLEDRCASLGHAAVSPALASTRSATIRFRSTNFCKADRGTAANVPSPTASLSTASCELCASVS